MDRRAAAHSARLRLATYHLHHTALFNNNWPLLNDLFHCATRAMLRHARKLGIEVGIFCALHSYGRQLNQHPQHPRLI